LNDLIGQLLKMLRRLLGENIGVVLKCSSDNGWVNADPGMMEQVVMNLCINARDAMPQGGRLEVGTTKVEIKSQPANPDARPGSFLCLSVSDTGCGIEETILGRIFEPFFTTKEGGKGTGLGLAMVYGIVNQHQGWVEVESAVGRGSSFRVYLPARETPLPAPSNPGGGEEVKGGSETILLVEDDPLVRRLAALGLRKMGYAVLEAGTGPEALKAWKEHHQSIELLFTDMVMPEGMTGLELAERLKQEKSSLKIIISSGYCADMLESHPKDGRDITFLPKPYAPAALARTVRHCLDKT
jgi:CheY-like chemotaxis protein